MVEIQLESDLLNLRELSMLVWLGLCKRGWPVGLPLLYRVKNPLLGALDLVDDATRLLASPCPSSVFHLTVVLPCFQGYPNQ